MKFSMKFYKITTGVIDSTSGLIKAKVINKN